MNNETVFTIFVLTGILLWITRHRGFSVLCFVIAFIAAVAAL